MTNGTGGFLEIWNHDAAKDMPEQRVAGNGRLFCCRLLPKAVYGNFALVGFGCRSRIRGALHG